ncbi:hypothetical protein KC19_2G043000 [Ceratodon purpureus]|uniref:Uncharacterized protein n=1 Tax=Ceratodon purpureus TaxID=3225 RepID=A0A8T0ISU7_CERPU|nr:hypothetical protein KC19_2G043000 [Ceratodon purpureus]
MLNWWIQQVRCQMTLCVLSRLLNYYPSRTKLQARTSPDKQRPDTQSCLIQSTL